MRLFHQFITEAKEGYRFVGANPTVDIAVFRKSKTDTGLEILLIRRKPGGIEGGKWALPGGFVNTTAKAGEQWKSGTETIAAAALRELEEETGLRIPRELKPMMRSVGIYKGGGRDPRDTKTAWSISYAYTITLPEDMGDRVRGQDDASDAKWFSVKQLPTRLAFDHGDIITDALGWSREMEDRKQSTAEIVDKTKDEVEKITRDVHRLHPSIVQKQREMAGGYVDYGHPLSPYERDQEEEMERIRREVWGVHSGGKQPELWVSTSEIKPSKGMTRVTIRKPKDAVRDTHEDVFPELLRIEGSRVPVVQGRIDHQRRVISATRDGEARFSSSALDRIFAELKRAYPGYKVYDVIDEGRIMSFLGFILEANRGLTRNKDEWDSLSIPEVRGNRDVQRDMFEIIKASYAYVGGHPDFPDAKSVPADNTVNDIIDTDESDDVDGIVLSKTTQKGRKITTLGSDGGTEAKQEVIRRVVDLLKQRGNYVEASGKILDILVAKGVPVVEDEATVRSVLHGKEIQWKGNGEYSRSIGGKQHTKKMLGNPIL